MHHTRHIQEDIFSDVLEKIQSLTVSQQKFVMDKMSRPGKVTIASKKRLLKKSFGIWAERKDIKDGIEYVDAMRKGWGTRLTISWVLALQIRQVSPLI